MVLSFRKVVQSLLASALLAGALVPGLSASAQDENVLRVQTEVEIATLDPNIATDGTSMEAIASLQEGLMTRNQDGEFVEAAAESYEVSEDGTVYTFKLREDAVWSNGSPVTAHDFVFSWQRLADPATAAEYSFILDTAGVKNAAKVTAGEVDKSELGIVAVDDYNFRSYVRNSNAFLLKFNGFLSIIPS